MNGWVAASAVFCALAVAMAGCDGGGAGAEADVPDGADAIADAADAHGDSTGPDGIGPDGIGDGAGEDAPAADADAEADAPTEDADGGIPPVECDRYNTLGHVEVQVFGNGGGVQGTFQSGPFPMLLDRILEDGPCAFYTFVEQPFCEPPCTNGDVCGFGDACHPWPGNLPMGTLTVGGTTPPIVLEPNESNTYYTTEVYPDFFTVGATLSVAATGSDAVPPFALSAPGISYLDAPDQALLMVQGEPFTISWEPAGGPAESRVRVHLDIDHHAAQAAYVECDVPDADGMLTISADLVDALIATGHSGIGTYVENAYMERFTRDVAPVDERCVQFLVRSQDWIAVDTQLVKD